MTRLDTLPGPPVEAVPLTAQQEEIMDIRHTLSRIAARLSRKPERIEWAVECLQREIERLRRLK